MTLPLLLSLALATTPDDLADALPQARTQLAACALDGCPRQTGAEAAFVLAVGTYLTTGEADGRLAATVQVLAPGLWRDLPDVLQRATSEPLAWADQVGGSGIPEPEPEPGPLARVLDDLARQADADANAKRVFVIGNDSRGHGLDNDRVRRQLTDRIPGATLYPAGDLCQQALVDPLATPRPTDEPAPLLDFSLRGTWTAPDHAARYQTWVDGEEVLVTDSRGHLRVATGPHQVVLLRASGVGPVLDVQASMQGPVVVRELAEQCIAQAADAGPEALAPHFRRLRERLPEGHDFVVDLRGARATQAPIHGWLNGQVVPLDMR